MCFFLSYAQLTSVPFSAMYQCMQYIYVFVCYKKYASSKSVGRLYNNNEILLRVK